MIAFLSAQKGEQNKTPLGRSERSQKSRKYVKIISIYINLAPRCGILQFQHRFKRWRAANHIAQAEMAELNDTTSERGSNIDKISYWRVSRYHHVIAV